ncbi:hypothetical protein WS9_013365 [Paraclostridium sordellii 8483]|uniref:hypothetical protein n=1 Tax=Paraclostridium sordellii TaxID=1505 RepID=UPI0003133457|nr:hypothetical protein [Paeniclostridium sordellii]TAN64777.1 hypothetical protein WS9_013365 [Paeniclostridium sordellii 8483]
MIEKKIKPKIQKVINKFPTEVTILRNAKNEYEEPTKPITICNIKGFWHDGSTMISQITTNGGKIKRDRQYFLMVLYDQVSLLIKEGDFFEHKGVKYEIVDKGNCNNMDIYFDMLLEEC